MLGVGRGLKIKGLDQVYYDLDDIRQRLVRLTEMDRIPRPIGNQLLNDVLAIQNKVENLIIERVEGGGPEG